jgi:hypothetical protein
VHSNSLAQEAQRRPWRLLSCPRSDDRGRMLRDDLRSRLRSRHRCASMGRQLDPGIARESFSRIPLVRSADLELMPGAPLPMHDTAPDRRQAALASGEERVLRPPVVDTRFPDSTQLSTAVRCAATSGSTDVVRDLVVLVAGELPAGRQRALPPHSAQEFAAARRAPAGVGDRRAPGPAGAQGSRAGLSRCDSIRSARHAKQCSVTDPSIGQLPDVRRGPSSTYSRQPRRRSETPET